MATQPPTDDPVERTARRLAALPEAAMRAATLAEQLAQLEPGDAAWLLDGLATAGRAGGPPYDLALLAAVEVGATDRLDYELRRTIFEAAERLGLEACKELLLSNSAEGDEDASAPRALRPGDRPLTLGERKSLARGWKRDILEHLLLDPHADVVKMLLINPRITEDNILRIATARRATPEVLQLIYDSKRWNCRPRVRRALLRNPKLPVASAVRLVGLLNNAELREIVGDYQLSDRVLHAIRRRLAPRD